jgi:uncharacterized protein YndB with AHSA1/START domain
MAHGSKAQARPIRFERVYDGPVEDLWALWTTKEGFEAWFPPEGCRVEVPVLDLRTGGAFDHVMIAVGDEQVAHVDRAGRPRSTRVSGHFVEVVPHERLHLRMTVVLPGFDPYPYDIVAEFRPEGERVRMIVTADAHPSADVARVAARAMEFALRQLEAILAAKRRERG